MKARRTPAAGEDDRHSPLLGPSDFVGAKLAAEDRGVVLDLAAWHHLDDVEQVELALRLLLAAHHQDVLEALVVFRAILGRAIAHAVELEAFQRSKERCAGEVGGSQGRSWWSANNKKK